MLKSAFKHFAFATTLTLASTALADEDQAGPTQDLTPVSLQFQRVAGEFGGESLRIFLTVKNVGSLPVRGQRGGIQIGAIVERQAPLYGPNGVGGFNLGAPIAPGASGHFLIYAPTTVLRHCQTVTARIDTAQSLQSGTSLVFYNDAKALTARESGAMRVCTGPIRQ